MKKKSLEGYFTVEASFIIPLAFLLIVLMIQFGFFCYEKSNSLQCCYLSALRASNKWELTGKEKAVYAFREAEQLWEERHLYPVNADIDTDVTLRGVEVELRGCVDVLFTDIRGDSIAAWKTDSAKTAGITVPSEYIRRNYTVKNIGGEDDRSNKQE